MDPASRLNSKMLAARLDSRLTGFAGALRRKLMARQ
jgi:hypothetical protein